LGPLRTFISTIFIGMIFFIWCQMQCRLHILLPG
jgi:hypothetical protein